MYLILKAVIERFYDSKNVSIIEVIPYSIHKNLINPTVLDIQKILTKSAADLLTAKTAQVSEYQQTISTGEISLEEVLEDLFT